MTGAKEAQKIRVMDRIPYIYYLIEFQKDKDKDILALLDSRSEVKAMTPAYIAQLGLRVQKTNVNA